MILHINEGSHILKIKNINYNATYKLTIWIFYKYTFVVPAHQTSDMSRSTISPESRSKLEMVIFSSLCFLTIWTFQYVNYQFMCPDFNKH